MDKNKLKSILNTIYQKSDKSLLKKLVKTKKLSSLYPEVYENILHASDSFDHGYWEDNIKDAISLLSNKNLSESKITSYIKLLEKYSGKKVYLKEADEATKNQAVNNLQFIKTSISNVLSKIEELHEIPILTRERNITLNKISHSLGKIDEAVDGLIEEITATRTKEQEKPLDEDVSMSTDDIIKNPQVVKKLSDNKVDIKVKDKNMSSSSSSAYR